MVENPDSPLKQAHTEHSIPLDKDDWEDVRIDQIEAGDEILSLNEATGQFEPARVNKLLKKGVQSVWKLTTASGKTIRTTAEHPYLVKDQQRNEIDFILNHTFAEGKELARWTKVKHLKPGQQIAVADTCEVKGVRTSEVELVWEDIASIEKTGREEVFDIEVEGTHNFVGNGIVAHNTAVE